MANKAMNKGTCQCCGAVQKLPAGILAKHGYTTRWGFFEGVCRGSGSQPFEKSTDLIEAFIRWAQGKVADLEAFKAELLTPPAEGTTEAWVWVYRKGSSHTPAGYQWMKQALTFTVETSKSGDGYQWMTVSYEHPDYQPGNSHRLDFYEMTGTNPLDRVYALNQKRAWAVDVDIQKLEEYIRWQ